MEERKMNFYESIYDLASIMSEKSRRNLLVAFLDYFFTGEEPEKLTVNERKAFEAVRGRIDASRSQGDKRRGKKKNQTDNQTGNQTGNQTDNQTGNQTGNQTDNQTGNQTGNQNRDLMRTDISPSLSLSNSLFGEGVQGEGFDPPTLDEARTYFAANCLKGDPELFWATYEAKGWLDGGGRPITSWTAQALKWSRMQVARDAERNGGELPPPPPRPVNAPDEGDLEADERAFFERYGYWPGEGDG